MSYYLAGDYYMAGDPGVFGFLGGMIKKVAGVGIRAAGRFLGGTPVGQAVTAITSAIGPTRAIPQMAPPPVMQAVRAAAPMLAPTGTADVGAPVGRARNVLIGGKRYHYNKYGELKKGKIPTINPMNPRALARSSRRIDSMRKGMGKALRHTNYKLVSKSAGRSRGSKGVITRSEAARALRG